MKNPTRVTVRAHAKINLDLRVLGTSPDGFHELRTVFQALALHDTVDCVRARRARSPSRATPSTCRSTDRISRGAPPTRCGVAAAAMRAGPRRARRDRRSASRCRRGLGGGRADAAATLVGLNRTSGACPVFCEPDWWHVAPAARRRRPVLPVGRHGAGARRAATRSIRSPICRRITGRRARGPALACRRAMPTAGSRNRSHAAARAVATATGTSRGHGRSGARETIRNDLEGPVDGSPPRDRSDEDPAHSGLVRRLRVAQCRAADPTVFGLFERRRKPSAPVRGQGGSGWAGVCSTARLPGAGWSYKIRALCTAAGWAAPEGLVYTRVCESAVRSRLSTGQWGVAKR